MRGSELSGEADQMRMSPLSAIRGCVGKRFFWFRAKMRRLQDG